MKCRTTSASWRFTSAANNATRPEPMLTISNLNVSISGSQILRGVNFQVPDRSVFCLMGRNGVGKTTTLKTIVGLQSAGAGSIQLDGVDFTRQRPDKRARNG